MPWMVAVLTWDADKKSQRGGKSLRDLLHDQFTAYSPRTRELVASNGRRTWREDFLFGRYSFVAVAGAWRDAFRCRAVQEILTAADKNPAVATDAEIDRFRGMEDEEGFVVLPDSSRRRLRRGDACKITEGPFADFDAVYRGMGRRDRELALVTLMGRKISVDVAAGALV